MLQEPTAERFPFLTLIRALGSLPKLALNCLAPCFVLC